MPYMEKRLGLVRAGAWAIVSEALTLIPVLVSFYVTTPPTPSGPAWSAALLFGGKRARSISSGRITFFNGWYNVKSVV